MQSKRFLLMSAMGSTVTFLLLVTTMTGDPLSAETKSGTGEKAKPTIQEKNRVSVEVARDRAKLMHDIYESTLDVIHHRYFRREMTVIPARAMEDIFSQMKRQSDIDARWISVNLKAMSVDHEPETDFEKKAAEAISAGSADYEATEDGYYRRAGAIPLTSGCISCHAGFFRDASKTPMYAALVISVPIVPEAPKSK